MLLKVYALQQLVFQALDFVRDMKEFHTWRSSEQIYCNGKWNIMK